MGHPEGILASSPARPSVGMDIAATEESIGCVPMGEIWVLAQERLVPKLVEREYPQRCQSTVSHNILAPCHAHLLGKAGSTRPAKIDRPGVRDTRLKQRLENHTRSTDENMATRPGSKMDRTAQNRFVCALYNPTKNGTETSVESNKKNNFETRVDAFPTREIVVTQPLAETCVFD